MDSASGGDSSAGLPSSSTEKESAASETKSSKESAEKSTKSSSSSSQPRGMYGGMGGMYGGMGGMYGGMGGMYGRGMYGGYGGYGMMGEPDSYTMNMMRMTEMLEMNSMMLGQLQEHVSMTYNRLCDVAVWAFSLKDVFFKRNSQEAGSAPALGGAGGAPGAVQAVEMQPQFYFETEAAKSEALQRLKKRVGVLLLLAGLFAILVMRDSRRRRKELVVESLWLQVAGNLLPPEPEKPLALGGPDGAMGPGGPGGMGMTSGMAGGMGGMRGMRGMGGMGGMGSMGGMGYGSSLTDEDSLI